MYLTQREAGVAAFLEGLQAMAFSPLSAAGYAAADAAGATEQTKDAVVRGGAALWNVAVGVSAGVGAASANSAGYSFGPQETRTPYTNREVRQWTDSAETALGELQQTSSFKEPSLEGQARLSNTIRRSITGEARSMMSSGGIVTEPVKGLEEWVGRHSTWIHRRISGDRFPEW